MFKSNPLNRRPSQVSNAVRVVDAFLAAHPHVKVIKIQYVSLSGAMVTRLVPVETFSHTIRTDGTHPGSGSIADLLIPSTNEIIPELMPMFTGTAKIVPDVSTLRIFHDSANLANTAIVTADIHFGGFDPRMMLASTVAAAETKHGLKFLVGIELEFCFLESNRVAPTSTNTKSFHSGWITDRSRYWPVLNEVIVALAEAGVPVIEAHKEYDSAQFEIALPPLPPVESVDAAIYARETIKNIAYRHNLFVTFYPDPIADGEKMRSGQHVHISAAPVSEKYTFEPDEFLGGILTHLRALCAIGMPSFDSYARTEEGNINAGGRVGYGTNNRDMPVRKVSQNHWEVRVSDATANPYLMVNAIIHAGLDAQPLTWKDVSTFPPMMTEEEKKAAGPFVPLPKSLEEALGFLKEDEEWAKKVFGEQLLQIYFAIKEHEIEVFGQKSEQERKLYLLQEF